ncbi:E3 ubiquitin-protein ligase-like [Antennarius striatus]|uniref:E3 ubiquitin-protein ligase-like n=1 Tax=Antennarius striatus TaxID=241820 RepID=UPI0035AF0A93
MLSELEDPEGGVFSELDCGVCYWGYDPGRRRPLVLGCKHVFCERCLLTLSCPRGLEASRQGPNKCVVCPLCRQATPIPGDGGVGLVLPVDGGVLERLLARGPPEEDQGWALLSDRPGQEDEAPTGSGGGRLWRSWRKVLKKIRGRSPRQRGGDKCIAASDMRNLALMTCYMF